MNLDDRPGLGGEAGGGVQGAVGRRLGDGDGEGRMDERLTVVAGEVLLGLLEYGRVVRRVRLVRVVADQAEDAADPGVTRGGRDHVDVDTGARLRRR